MKNLTAFLTLIIFIIILSVPAYSVTKENINLEVGKSVVIGGRNFTLVSISNNDKMLIEIDDEKYVLSSIETEYVNGIYIYPINIYSGTASKNPSIDVNISMNYSCGNNKCETPWENSENCCIDCSCSANYTCYNKKCFESTLIQCYKDAECKDNDSCTEDYCQDFPKICKHRNITECRHGDGCCPENCTADEDEDCSVEKPKCKTNADCDDSNASTIDKCSEITNWCYHVPNETKEEKEEALEIEENVTIEKSEVKKEKSFFQKLIEWIKGLF